MRIELAFSYNRCFCVAQVITKSFEVAEYVLPAFHATVSVSAAVAISDRKFTVSVGAKYNFGQKIEGTATVKFVRWGENT